MKNPNGFGSIVNLGQKRRRPFAIRITVGYDDNGKQKFKYLSYHEKRQDAIMALAEYNKAPYDLDSNRITFGEIYERWKNKKFDSLSASSQKRYRAAYKVCAPLEKMIFKDLRKNHLQSVIDDKSAHSMKNAAKILIQQLYTYALENDIIQKDYSQFIEIPKNSPTKKKTPFSNEEIDVLWNKVKEIPQAGLCLILLYSGMRVSELLDMPRENVNLEERYMIGGNKTEAGINRMIPIHDRIYPFIEGLYNSNTDSKWLIITKTGAKMTYANYEKRYFKELMKELGFKHSCHETRHTFISRMHEVGADPLIMKRIVGHSDKNVTEGYTHITPERLLEEINKLP